MGPKLFTIIGGLGGGCGLFPLLYWQWQASELKTEKISQVPSVSAPKSALPSSPEPTTNIEEQAPTVIRQIETGNCQTVDIKQDLSSFLWDNGGKWLEDFTGVFCRNTSEKEDVKISKSWTGLFPNSLLLREYSQTKNKKFNLKTETTLFEGEGGKYRTTFSGNGISSTIVGEWGDTSKTAEGKSITSITVLEGKDKSEPIFIVNEEN